MATLVVVVVFVLAAEPVLRSDAVGSAQVSAYFANSSYAEEEPAALVLVVVLVRVVEL